jgi:hypothetical protein
VGVWWNWDEYAREYALLQDLALEPLNRRSVVHKTYKKLSF